MNDLFDSKFQCRLVVAWFFVTCLSGCVNPSPIKLPAASGDAGATVADAPDDATARGCSAACKHLRALGCQDGEPTAEGATCEVVCSNAAQSGFAPLNTTCLSSAKSCAAADMCGAAK